MEPVHFCRVCQEKVQVFESTVGDHTTLRCAFCGFPVDEAELRALEGAGASRAPAHILMIDDEDVIARMFAGYLASHGFRVSTANDGPSGLAVGRRDEPDLIILDIMMPGMDGYEVCRRIRDDAILREIPVILLTALRDPSLSQKAFQAGADLALAKPIEPSRLRSLLNVALGIKRHPGAP